jgi:hypothetical protein
LSALDLFPGCLRRKATVVFKPPAAQRVAGLGLRVVEVSGGVSGGGLRHGGQCLGCGGGLDCLGIFCREGPVASSGSGLLPHMTLVFEVAPGSHFRELLPNLGDFFRAFPPGLEQLCFDGVAPIRGGRAGGAAAG